MKKGQKTKKAVLATTLFLVFGVACIMVGFGIANGWQWVLNWFTSQWAVYVYIFVFFYVCGAILIWWWGSHNE